MLPTEQVKEDLKSMIFELARHERVKLTADETDVYVEECGQIVERCLSIETLQRGAHLASFMRLIRNEQARDESRCFSR